MQSLPPDPSHDPAAHDDAWTVICLCAAWCRTCDAYRPLLAGRAQRDAATRHLWLDVEDDAELLGDLDIETFPTLLIARGGEPLFFAPVLPQLAALDQALARVQAGMAPLLPADAGARADLARLARHVQRTLGKPARARSAA